MANWPTSADVVLGLVAPATLAGPPTHEQIHEQNAEILAALEAELGLNPSGADLTVAALLDRLTPRAATVLTAQATNSTVHADLATVGPTVTLVTGTLVLVTIRCDNNNNVNGNNMAVAVSGATSIAATSVVVPRSTTSNTVTQLVLVNAGTNTFTAKYQAPAADTVTFSNRHLVVQRVN